MSDVYYVRLRLSVTRIITSYFIAQSRSARVSSQSMPVRTLTSVSLFILFTSCMARTTELKVLRTDSVFKSQYLETFGKWVSKGSLPLEKVPNCREFSLPWSNPPPPDLGKIKWLVIWASGNHRNKLFFFPLWDHPRPVYPLLTTLFQTDLPWLVGRGHNQKMEKIFFAFLDKLAHSKQF